ncbi:MAG: hypothetical protein NVV83_19845 [Afipia sp.]|nr:hypothetical protein [Afipia sp.]
MRSGVTVCKTRQPAANPRYDQAELTRAPARSARTSRASRMVEPASKPVGLSKVRAAGGHNCAVSGKRRRILIAHDQLFEKNSKTGANRRRLIINGLV